MDSLITAAARALGNISVERTSARQTDAPCMNALPAQDEKQSFVFTAAPAQLNRLATRYRSKSCPQSMSG